jgi:hypothetical protein
MDYQHHYTLLIAKRKKERTQGYSEIHHIVPRSWGGSDDPSNLVRLSAREHRFAHLLLFKLSSGKKRADMAASIFLIGKTTSRAYEMARIEVAKRMSEISRKRMRENNPFKGKPSNIAGRIWITNGNKNRCIDPNDAVPEGWRKGRSIVLTEEGRARKSATTASSNRARKNPLKEKKWKMSPSGVQSCRKAAALREQRRIAAGKPHHAQHGAYARGRCWINKEGSTKMIDPSDMQQMLGAGWSKGRLSR